MSRMNPEEGGKPGSPLRIGTAPVNWNNNDLAGWRPLIPFPAILDEMRAAGYSATEWDESFGTNIEVLDRERKARGMTFTGAYRWLDFADDDQFERDLGAIMPLLDTMQGIGARNLIVADSLRPHRVSVAGNVPMDRSLSLDAGGYARIVANLERLAEEAARFGLQLHYHNHAGSHIETPWELAGLLDRLDLATVDLCFDTGHYAFGGGDPIDFIEKNRRAIGYLHLKDVDELVLSQSRSNRWSFTDALRNYIFCPLGTGSAQIPRIVEFLAEAAFPGYVIIEQDTCRGSATGNARDNLAAVQRYAPGSFVKRRQDP